jgi:hypothetical protein
MTVRLRLCALLCALSVVGAAQAQTPAASGNSSSRPRGSEHGPKEDGMSAMVIYPFQR